MKKLWGFTLCAVLLFGCASTNSWAYRIKVTNGLSSEDAPFSYYPGDYTDYIVTSGLGDTYGVYLKRGDSKEFNLTDWKHAGLCWTSIEVRMPRWPDCPKD